MAKITFEDKIPSVGDNPASWTENMVVSAENLNEIKAVVNGNSDQAGSYKSCLIRVNQSGEGDLLPTFTVINNNLGGTISWAQDPDGSGGYQRGYFIGTLEGAFKPGKTNVISSVATRKIIEGFYLDDNTIGIEVIKLTDGTLDNKVGGNFIRIEVYD